MDTIINALMPLVALMVLGLVLRRSGFLEQAFWDQAENLVYYVLAPVMLVRTIGSSTLGTMPWLDMVLVVYGVLILTSITLIIGYWLIAKPNSGPLFTAVFQGGVRFNTYIALALMEAIHGATGLALAGVVAGFMIVLINFVLVSVMTAILDSGKLSMQKILSGLGRNPLILGCLVGGALNATGLGFPTWMDGALSLVAGMALPIALMCVGASLRLKRLKGDLTPALISSGVQFVYKPLLAYGLALWIGLPGIGVSVVVIFMSVPTAVSGYILARKMGGDPDAMATIITFQTLAGFITLPIVLSILTVLGTLPG